LFRKTVSSVMLVLLVASMLTLAFETQTVKAGQRTWTVDDDGPADFHTIHEALNATSYGDTVYVYNGTYYEQLSVPSGVSLVGENRDTTIIDGNATSLQQLESSFECVVWLDSNDSIGGFTIRNGGYGIGSSRFNLIPTFTGNNIEGNRIVDNLGAIYLKGCALNTVANNIIGNNTFFGIHLDHAGNNTLVNNTIVGNGHGIDFYGNSNNNMLRNNDMTDNKYNFGLILRGATFNWVYGSPSQPGIVNDVDASNTVNSKPIYYWTNRSNERVPSDAGYIWLNNCTNITIDGCSLSNNLQGILLTLVNNSLIVNNSIDSNVYGIDVFCYSSNNTVTGNTLEDNLNGIYLDCLSRFTTMRNNKISGGQRNFGVYPWLPMFTDGSDLINDIDTSNTVDGKPIVYWIDQHDRQVPRNAGYVILINSTNILAEGLNLSHNFQNIFLVSTNNTVIANSTITNSVYGIEIKGASPWPYQTYYVSFNTTVAGNILVDNGVGIRMQSNSSTISNNTLLGNPVGIYLPSTCNSTISANVVADSDLYCRSFDVYQFSVFHYPEPPWELSDELRMLDLGGIILGGDNNIVCSNTVMNSWVGISTATATLLGTNNNIFHNNLIKNHNQAWGLRYPNQWDDGYPSGGNFWSDYNGTDLYKGSYQNETGSDGIGDTPYMNSYGVNDRYPSLDPFPWTSSLPSAMKINVKAGDRIKYDYTIAGSPPGTPLPEWMKVQFLSVDQTSATANVTMHMSDGTEQNQTMTLDILTGQGTLFNFSGFLVPAYSAAGDFAYLSGLGIGMISDVTARTYAGASRTIICTGWSQSLSGISALTYCWDKQTGVMVEASVVSGDITATAKAIETNMWQTHLLLVGDLNVDGKVNRQDATTLANAFGSYLGHPRWKPNADINGDNVVNILDAIILGNHFLEHYP